MKDRDRKISLLILIIAICLFGAFLVSLIRSYGAEFYLREKKSGITSKKLANKWLEAVKNEQPEKAMLIARQIIGEKDPASLPRTDYLITADNNLLTSEALTDDFNSMDFTRWNDSLKLKNLALELKQQTSPQNYVPFVVKTVTDRIKITQDPVKKHSLSLVEAWEKKSGTKSDRSRLICGLLEQAGYTARVIASVSNQNPRQPLHMFFELKKGNEYWVVDPEAKLVCPLPVWEFIKKSSLYPPDWSQAIRDSLKNPLIILQLSEFADYRTTNQKLAEKLSRIPQFEPPVFGQSPYLRMKNYEDSFPKKRKDILTYWQLPFSIAKSNRKPLPESAKNHPSQ
jgi:hypothetical protein